MKTLAALAAAAMLLAWGNAAVAAGLLGPPEPEAPEYGSSLAVGYDSVSTEWKADRGALGDVSAGRTQAYAQLLGTGIGFGDRGAGFLRVGGADFDDGADFQAGYKPFASAGIKDVWYGGQRTRYQVGTILVASYYQGHEAQKTLAFGETVKARIRYAWDAGLGIAVQASPAERISVYGGPLFVYGVAKVMRGGAGFDTEARYKEKSPAGLFAGAKVTLSRRLVAVVEAQYRSDVTAGAAIAWSFD